MKSLLKGKRFFTFEKGLACFTGILLIMLVVFSCNNIIAIKEGGSLIIALPGTRATTASHFTIELTGTSGFNKRETLAGGTTAQFDDLAPDTYSIVVEGMDTNNKVVLGGASSATVVAGETVTVPVKLQNLLGSLTVDFVGAESDSVTEYTVILSGPNEFNKTQEVTIRTVQFEGLIPGDYTVSVSGQDSDGAGVLSGTAEVTVTAGQTKSVTVELQKLLGSLTIDFSESATSSATEFKVELNIGDTLFKRKDVSGVTSVQFDDLALATYSISVEGKNEDGLVVLYGTSSATVSAGATASATVKMGTVANDLNSLRQAITAGGIVYIGSDIDVDSTLTVSTDATLLPLDKAITLKQSGDIDLISVTAGKLTVGGNDYTITLDGNSEGSSTSTKSLIKVSGAGSTIYLNRNSVVMNNAGTGVSITGANALNSSRAFGYLNGGTISNNKSGGVSLSNAEFIMNDGLINGNSGVNGAGVNMFTSNTSFVMKGGNISNNVSTGNGGGVYVSSNSSCTMDGGSIEGNSATGNGGGVSVSSGTFIMNGGTIVGNKVEGDSSLGRGVYFNDGNTGDLKFSGNPVIDENNDVYYEIYDPIKISGPLNGTDSVATITFNEYKSTQVLSAENGVTLTEDIISKFAVTPNGAESWKISTNGTLEKDEGL